MSPRSDAKGRVNMMIVREKVRAFMAFIFVPCSGDYTLESQLVVQFCIPQVRAWC